MSGEREGWKRVKPYLPNSSRDLAIVAIERAQTTSIPYWPMKITQLIGGRTWSLSLVRLDRKGPTS